MTTIEIYEKESGNKAPDNPIAYSEWYIGYVKWLEKQVQNRIQIQTCINALDLINRTSEKCGFKNELEALINKHSAENGSNTPDFILAKYLNNCLQVFDDAVNVRSAWYDGDSGIKIRVNTKNKKALKPSIIKHDLDVYYNPNENGFHVVHSQNDKFAIVGTCSMFYSDAYTCILRYKAPVNILNNWIKINKEYLLDYSFVDTKMQNTVHVIDKDGTNYDLKRCTWYKNYDIIERYSV